MHYDITTPEQVRFRYEVAGLASRAMAWLVDQLILWVARAVAAVALVQAGQFGVGAFLVVIFVADFGYHVWFELWRAGQSPGKRVFGLRVIAASGGRLSFADVMIRNLIRAVDTLPMMMVVGGVVALVDRYHRRLGDLAAETLVVRDVRAALPRTVLRTAYRDNTFAQDPALCQRIVARATRAERDLLFDLMMRRDELAVEPREELFARAARHFRDRFNVPDHFDHLSDEQTVLNLALVLQAQAARQSVGASAAASPHDASPTLDRAATGQ